MLGKNSKIFVAGHKYLQYLISKNIEKQPIIRGNFLNQPATKLYNFKNIKKDFIDSGEIEKKSLFISLHTKPITSKKIKTPYQKIISIE